MTSLLELTEAPPERAYSPLLDDLLAALRSGTLAVGDRLPTEQQLSARYGISVTSVRKGIDRLVALRLVTRRQGSGTYVTARPPAQPPVQRTTVLIGWEWNYTVYHPYFSELLRGLHDELAGRGWQVGDLIKSPGEASPREGVGALAVYRHVSAHLLSAVLAGRDEVAGLIVSTAIANLLEPHLPAGLPLVNLGPHPRLPFAGYDWRHEASRAVQAVLETGAREVAVFSGYPPAMLAEAVQRACRAVGSNAAVRVHALPGSHVVSTVMRQAAEAARAALAPGQPRPDGLVITDDFASQGVLDVLAELGGIAAPLPIACLVSRLSRLQTPFPLMRLVADGYAEGRAAAELLDRQVREPHQAPQEIVFAGRWERDRAVPRPPVFGWTDYLTP
jgi:DNA-binding LacI/PurR family transcriptional regulator